MDELEKERKLQKLVFESEERYRSLLHSIPDIVYKVGPQGHFQFLNNSISQLGYKPEELLGKHFSIIIHPDDIQRVSRDIVLSKIKSEKNSAKKSYLFFDERRSWLSRTENLEVRLIPKNALKKGSFKEMIASIISWGEVSASGYYNDDTGKDKKVFLGTVGIIRDITRRKKSEELLRKLFWAVDQSPVSVIISDEKGTIEYINPHFIHKRGYSPQEIIGSNVRILKSNYHPKEIYDQIKKSLKEKGEWRGELFNKRKNGNLFWESITISAVMNQQGVITNYISIQEDITEKKRTAKQLKTLREKETLLKEIHHRVKNNLQIICSIINLQLHTLDDQNTIKVFKQCESRIKTMALIHEKLYQARNLAKIDFAEYLKSLAFHLLQSYQIDQERIKMTLDMDHILFNIDIAIPCGLIVNELLTNALKHAFPEKRSGKIIISLKDDVSNYILSVADNGCGLPKSFNIKETESLGLQIVVSLVKQLNGTVKLSKKELTAFKVIFPKADK